MSKIGLIFNGVWSHYTFAKAPKYRELYDLVYVYDLTYEQIKDYDAVIVPFQSNQKELSRRQDILYRFLANGKKVFVEGDSSTDWIEGVWEDRPVNNYWWVENPDKPPITDTDYTHPIYRGLKPRHACWHIHGIYVEVPDHAKIIQTNDKGEVISWQTHHYGGTLFATTLDPVVEHGIQQITHLDNYVDRLTEWLCGENPEGSVYFEKQDFGIEEPVWQ